MSTTCVRCGAPTDAAVCHPEALSLAETLRTAAGHAEDAWTVIARQARVGTAGGTRAPEPEPAPTAEDLRRNPVTAFGWQASIERPLAGALRPEPGPADLGAFDRLRAVENTVGTWARDLDSWAEGLIEACLWLAEHVEILRTHPAAQEAFDELHDACRQLERLVDRPADKRLVGVCDCGKVLYAAGGRSVVQCPERTCEMKWDVGESRDILRRHLDDRLVTAGEAARLGQYLDGDRTQDQIRALISRWMRGAEPLIVRGEIRGERTYRFGDVVMRLARTPRRQQRLAEAANTG